MENAIANQLSGERYRDVKQVADTGLPWEELDGRTVLVTGAGGFIASYLILSMLIQNDEHGRGITVLGMVRNFPRAREKYRSILDRKDFKLVEQDVCEDFAFGDRADYVIHAASQASAWHFEHDPVGTIRANLIGTEKVLQYARRCGSRAVLLISSLKVYGEVTDGSKKLAEPCIGYLDHVDYKNCYAAGKRGAEALCACYHRQYGLHVKIARPAYIYGPTRLDDDRVWAQFIANVVRKEDILLKSSGDAYRSFCYVADAARALLLIMLKGEDCLPYNISSGQSDVTIRDFAKIAVKAFPERNLKLSFAHPEDAAEPAGIAAQPMGNAAQPTGNAAEATGKAASSTKKCERTPEILDNGRLRALGWEAQVTAEEGIRRAVLIAEEDQGECNG